MKSNPQYVTIVPPESESTGIVKTQGTKVMLGDQELTGVYKIILTAQVNDIWKAEIHCHPRMTSLSAEAIVHYPKRWWERVIDWIVGNSES